MMEKREFIEALQELVSAEDVLSVGKAVNDLRIEFEDYLLEEERKIQVAQLEAEEKGEEYIAEEWTHALKEEFYSIYAPYNEKRKEVRDAQRKVENDNLTQKRALITRLKELIETEENIGAAFSAHKEINDKWKEIGDIPRDKRHDIQQEYSRLMEEFFYNMNIYKEIKEYDFKKNHEAKKDVITRLKELLTIEKIREVEVGIKQLQNEWDDIGPTKQELWEEIKNEYWETVNSIYERIREFYDGIREQRQENLQKKQGLVTEMEGLLQEARDSVKKWNDDTKKVLKLQETWKTIGFGPRKENEEVWKEFRGLCDNFFEQKSVFFEDIIEEFDKVAELKKGLIDQVNELKDSQDWGPTTKAIINIQKQWKKAGNAGQKFEQKLWREFRAACDHFFNAKDAHFAEKDKEFEVNLVAKQDLIKELKEFALPEEKKEAITALKEFSKRFAEIGFVPNKVKDAIYKEYKEALYTHYESLDMKDVEKEKVMFEARINTIKGSGRSSELFAKEKQAIRDEINKVQQQINQFENNLGFFANSKGANALKEQVEKNIKVEQDKLVALKAKLKMIPNE